MNTPHLDKLIQSISDDEFSSKEGESALSEFKAIKEALNTLQPTNSPECAKPSVVASQITDKTTLKLIIEALENISLDAASANGGFSRNFREAEKCFKKLNEIANE